MIERSDRDSVAVLRMAYGKANVLDLDFLAELSRVFEEVAGDASVRALVLTGSGTIFCAGIDLFKVVEGREAYLDRFLPALGAAFQSLFVLPKPVVAGVNGHAIAGGCVLVEACDYRIMARGDGTIGIPELVVGVPFPMLALEIVRFALAPQHLQAAAYTGATYSPDEAQRRGFVDELVDLDQLLERACEMADRMAAMPAESFRITKHAARLPVIERFERTSSTFDAEVMAAWKDPRTLEVMQAYVEQTLRRKK